MATPIQILLSVYNGAKYLPEQQASLDAQQDAPEWSLLWRDDGSSDGSASLLRDHPRATELVDDTPHLGPALSFLHLLAAAPGDAKAFAFCDQDDVWMPDKLARAWSWCSSQPSGYPALYFARQKLVDAVLRPIGLSPEVRRPPSFKNALAQNIATGCTIMMNAAARQLVLSAPSPPIGSMHDWWTYLLVSGAGGAICADPYPALLYRQHDNNAVGVAASILRRACGVIARGPGNFIAIFDAHLAALSAAESLLTPDANETVLRLHQLWSHPPLKRLLIFSIARVYRQGLLEDLVLRSFVLLGGSKSHTKLQSGEKSC